MKKTLALILAILILTCLFTACAAEKAEETVPEETETAEPKEEGVTAEEAFSRTGIELKLPETAEEVEWLVVTMEDGREIPQVNFLYNGAHYSYRAENTDETEPYNFSGLDGEWTSTGEGGDEKYDYISAGNDNGSWCAWLDKELGIAYVVSSHDAEDGEADCIASMLAWPETWMTDDDGEWTEHTLTGAELIPGTVWKHEGYEAYIQVLGNGTYMLFDKDRNCDGKIFFWTYLEDDPDSMVLNNEFGGESTVLTLTGEWGDCYVTDSAGDRLLPYTGAMNGTYYCFLNQTYLDSDTLYVTQQLLHWMSDWEVDMLEIGSVINNTDMEMFDIVVESIEKKDDAHYIVNGEFELTRDDTVGAWLFSDDVPMWERAGECTVSADTGLIDTLDNGEHTSLYDCLAAHDGIYAYITVEGGKAVSIEIAEEF